MAIKVCAHHGAPIEGALGTLENAPHLAEVVFEFMWLETSWIEPVSKDISA